MLEENDEAMRLNKTTLSQLQAHNNARWQILQSLYDDKDVSTLKSDDDDDDNSISISQVLQREIHLQKNEGEWKTGIGNLLERLKSDKVSEETMEQFDQELIETCHELLETIDFLEKEIELEGNRLQDSERSVEQLKGLKYQVELGLAEQAASLRQSQESVACGVDGIDTENTKLWEELHHVADIIEDKIKPPEVVQRRNRRRQKDESSTKTTVPTWPLNRLLQELLLRVLNDKEEDQYLLTSSDDYPINDRHLQYLREHFIVESFEENSDLVRILPEYKSD